MLSSPDRIDPLPLRSANRASPVRLPGTANDSSLRTNWRETAYTSQSGLKRAVSALGFRRKREIRGRRRFLARMAQITVSRPLGSPEFGFARRMAAMTGGLPVGFEFRAGSVESGAGNDNPTYKPCDNANRACRNRREPCPTVHLGWSVSDFRDGEQGRWLIALKVDTDPAIRIANTPISPRSAVKLPTRPGGAQLS